MLKKIDHRNRIISCSFRYFKTIRACFRLGFVWVCDFLWYQEVVSKRKKKCQLANGSQFEQITRILKMRNRKCNRLHTPSKSFTFYFFCKIISHQVGKKINRQIIQNKLKAKYKSLREGVKLSSRTRIFKFECRATHTSIRDKQMLRNTSTAVKSQ